MTHSKVSNYGFRKTFMLVGLTLNRYYSTETLFGDFTQSIWRNRRSQIELIGGNSMVRKSKHSSKSSLQGQQLRKLIIAVVLLNFDEIVGGHILISHFFSYQSRYLFAQSSAIQFLQKCLIRSFIFAQLFFFL